MSKGINFKKLRNDAGLTLAHLAELSGYDVTDIVRLEQGEKIPPCIRECILALLLQAREEGLALDVSVTKHK